ncbi:hypothetical protein ATANTOWER_005708 [Ataeniobius toweri]|uniref:Uncharacterized protein n=1 Tax=Ataeniobius toweri TaxID=208326 RepID=A0ABU7BU12_9TELE|nr:hypothetical protein [Ataeniobius toweri]
MTSYNSHSCVFRELWRSRLFSGLPNKYRARGTRSSPSLLLAVRVNSEQERSSTLDMLKMTEKGLADPTIEGAAVIHSSPF